MNGGGARNTILWMQYVASIEAIHYPPPLIVLDCGSIYANVFKQGDKVKGGILLLSQTMNKTDNKFKEMSSKPKITS